MSTVQILATVLKKRAALAPVPAPKPVINEFGQVAAGWNNAVPKPKPAPEGKPLLPVRPTPEVAAQQKQQAELRAKARAEALANKQPGVAAGNAALAKQDAAKAAKEEAAKQSFTEELQPPRQPLHHPQQPQPQAGWTVSRVTTTLLPSM